jgi:hypothetical protein
MNPWSHARLGNQYKINENQGLEEAFSGTWMRVEEST